MWAPAVDLPAPYSPSSWHNASVPNADVSAMLQQGKCARKNTHLLAHNNTHSRNHLLGWNFGKVPGETSIVFCTTCGENVRASRGTGSKSGHTTSHPTHVLTLMDSILPSSPRHHLSKVAKTPLPVKQKVKTTYGQTAKACGKEYGWGKLTVFQVSQDPAKNAIVLQRMKQ